MVVRTVGSFGGVISRRYGMGLLDILRAPLVFEGQISVRTC